VIRAPFNLPIPLARPLLKVVSVLNSKQKYMKTLTKLTLALAIAGASTLSVHAIAITGNIKMGGTVNLDSTLLGSATAATGFSNVTVEGTPTGSFVGTDLSAGSQTTVNWAGFAFNSGTDVALWSFTDADNGWTYSFALDNNVVATQTNYGLLLLGNGTLDIVGAGDPYTATAGTWSFTITHDTGAASPNFEFAFGNSQTAAGVPDGGATAILLGVGLLGLGALRRKA
jgi:hypothetical protein